MTVSLPFPLHPSPTSPPRCFRFNDETRGRVTFNGNILFTHFGEIEYNNPFQQAQRTNTNELDIMSGGATMNKPKHSATFT